jgi:hypothetical protein
MKEYHKFETYKYIAIFGVEIREQGVRRGTIEAERHMKSTVLITQNHQSI